MRACMFRLNFLSNACLGLSCLTARVTHLTSQALAYILSLAPPYLLPSSSLSSFNHATTIPHPHSKMVSCLTKPGIIRHVWLLLTALPTVVVLGAALLHAGYVCRGILLPDLGRTLGFVEALAGRRCTCVCVRACAPRELNLMNRHSMMMIIQSYPYA